MSFKFVLTDQQGAIYVVTDEGNLLFYRDQARNGTSNWAFGGTGQRIGSGWGNFGGGASGWEMDTSNAGDHGDDGVEVSASVASDRGDPPDGLQLLARGTNSGAHAADMTYYDTGEGGFVFSVGSICFGGSMVQNGNLQTIVANALNKAIAETSISAHG